MAAQAAVKRNPHRAADPGCCSCRWSRRAGNHDNATLGASRAAGLALYNATRAWAALQGRDYVIPDDVKDLAETSLAHRLIMSPAARMKNVDSRLVVRELLTSTPVPGARAATQGGVLRWRWRHARSPRRVVSTTPTARYNWLKLAGFAVVILVLAQLEWLASARQALPDDHRATGDRRAVELVEPARGCGSSGRSGPTAPRLARESASVSASRPLALG